MDAVINNNDWIVIARITRPQGVRGEVIADILTDFPERFAELEKVTTLRGENEIGSLELEFCRFHQQRIVFKFVSYDDKNTAESLRDLKLVIPRDEAVELDEDQFYVFDLVDCEVITVEGQALGKVVRVDDFGAAPLLTVSTGQKEFLIPLTHEICPDVDTTAKKIIVNPPVGLLDL